MRKKEERQREEREKILEEREIGRHRGGEE